MTITVAHITPLVALIAGILILLVPRLLNYISGLPDHRGSHRAQRHLSLLPLTRQSATAQAEDLCRRRQP
jgi:hypothetical protein